MNEILTNGTEIKQRIISEIEKASQNIYIAMAWFTDRDIAEALIAASKKPDIIIDIILSSNVQNESVKKMLQENKISIHSFKTGDERGLMHHKFCLIDNKISINGSYNYSFNASSNNVENILITSDPNIYKQLLDEFERLKYNIDHEIDINKNSSNPMQQINEKIDTATSIDTVQSFSKHLSNLVYTTTNIDTEEYRKQGYKNSEESSGNIDIFKAHYDEIKEKVRVFATDDSLNSKKNIISQHIKSALEKKLNDLEKEKQYENKDLASNFDLKSQHELTKISELKQKKSILEAGDKNTGEKGLLQINNDKERVALEKSALESTFIIKKFWTLGSVIKIALLIIFTFYLSIFFSSAIYKTFFEKNAIREALEVGINLGNPILVDANAILTIFQDHGVLFGIIAMMFFIIPVLISNLKLIGSKNERVNKILFWIGLLIFDILVAIMVTRQTDEINSLLIGKDPQLKFWEVFYQVEFYLIFVFGMLPLIIMHFLLNDLENSYRNSQGVYVNAEKNRELEILNNKLLDLNLKKETLTKEILEIGDSISTLKGKLELYEEELNKQKSQVERRYNETRNNIMDIYDDYMARIITGRIFTEEILNSVATAYKTGFIEYLPQRYATNEVRNIVNNIEEIIS